jgi:hypothetical protein
VSSAVTPFATVEEAVEDIRNGRMVVVVDDPDRENEGDLVLAAQFATPEAVNFMATHARGLIASLTDERCEELGLPPMAQRNEAPLGTASRSPSRPARASRPASPRQTVRTRSRSRSIPSRSRTTSSSPATSFPCGRAMAVSSSAPARPRPRSTSPVSPACLLRAWSARS